MESNGCSNFDSSFEELSNGLIEQVDEATTRAGGPLMSATTPSAFTVPASSTAAAQRIPRAWILVGHWLVAMTVAAGVIAGLVATAAIAGPVLAQAAGESATAEAARSGDAAAVLPQPALRQHRVLPGDTVWSLAIASSSADPRETVDRIMELNGLVSPSLQVGEELILPNG